MNKNSINKSMAKPPLVISLLDPPLPVIIEQTGRRYILVTTKEGKAMLQAAK
jgi:hypothetical protein